MSVGHQSPQSSLPPLSQKVLNTTTWGSTPNSVTITDEYVHPNSWIDIQVSGATPQNGFWAVTTNEGSFTITSSNSESSTLPISYVIL